MNIDLIKSCKAITHYRDLSNRKHTLINTELIRYTKFKKNRSLDKKIYDDYLNDILSKTTLIGEVSETTKLCNDTVKKKVFIGITDLPNVIRNVDDNYKNIYSQINEKKKFQICGIKKNTEKYMNKIEKYPLYFVDLLFNDDNKEKQLLKNANGNDFYYEDELVIILPDFVSNKFHLLYVDEWNTLKDIINNQDINMKENYDLILNILYQVNFVLFIKDNTIDKDNIKNYQFKSIFDFDRSNVHILESIKEKIIEFYKNKFFFGDEQIIQEIIDNNLMDIYVNADTKYDFIVLNFSLVDRIKGRHYMSFIDLYKKIKLDDIIETVKSKNDQLIYFSRIEKDKANINNCPDNFEVRHQNSLIGGDIKYKFNNIFFYPKKYNTIKQLFGIDFGEIEVINQYAPANNTHSYCAEFFIIKVKNLKEEALFEISIKSITYNVLAKYKYIGNYKNRLFGAQKLDSFNNKFIEKLDEIKLTKNKKYYFDYLPAVIEINVKKIDNNKSILVRNYLLEKAEDYKQHVLPIIKNANIKLNIIILLTWKAEFRRYFGNYDLIEQKNVHKWLILSDTVGQFEKKINIQLKNEQIKFFNITKKLLMNPLFGFYIIDFPIFTQNFVIVARQYDNNLKIIFCLLTLIKNDLIKSCSWDEFKILIEKLICENITYKKNKFDIEFSDSTINKDNINRVFEYFYHYLNDTVMIYLFWHCKNELKFEYFKFGNVLDQANGYLKSILDNNVIEQLNENKIKYILDKLNNYINNINDRNIVSEFTNFYQLFNNGLILYNMRHLNDSDKNEIDNILYKLYKFRKINYFTYLHYPNILLDSIVHGHIYPKSLYGKIVDKIGRYIDIGINRAFLWEKQVKYVDLMNKNIFILTGVNVMLNKINDENYIKNHIKSEIIKYLKEIGRSFLIKNVKSIKF